ncbi:LysR family transcriptional regulator [Acuticoccus sp. M5D2P5]|uniref:LysR family transcriptional regulator n=1 Tax=Acuticoccus kalidii TaxID=2910977 RepID=UPI001F1AFC1B|nr:LysR family transcriptional regulator [Acuticoccus kalidii]MCF3934037.1 LysR family transcriptional regulator [Acuticoccus kalidii]
MVSRLDIGALEALAAVADLGGVTRAAERLALSQSAVSHKLRRLEESLGCTLLRRRPGASLLTSEGERLLGYARRILALHDEAAMSLGRQPLTGKIRLGMTADMTGRDISRILGRFARLHPDVAVRTTVTQSLSIENALDLGEAEIGIMQLFESRCRPSDIVLFRDELHWVKAPDHRLDLSRPVPFVAFHDDCFFQRWAIETNHAQPPGFETVFTCGDTAGLVSAIESGLGVGLLAASHLTAEIEVVTDLFPVPPAIATVVRAAPQARSEAVRSLVKEIAGGIAHLRMPEAA